MSENEWRAQSWTELQELLFRESWKEELGLHRSDYAFRGCDCCDESLATSLVRHAGGHAAGLEAHLLRNFRKYAAREAVPADSVWNWIALGQHHGLPTRLLDWTFSPYVALHFATCAPARADCDGSVWLVDYVRAHELLPDRFRSELEYEGANVFTTELLGRVATDLARLAEPGEEFALFVEPPSFDDRIVNQYALFSLGSHPALSLEAWLREHPELWRRIVIPAGLKWEVRDKLDQANVTERVLMPGLDGLSSWLARFYLPRSEPGRSKRAG
jgi:hypothetical protein